MGGSTETRGLCGGSTREDTIHKSGFPEGKALTPGTLNTRIIIPGRMGSTNRECHGHQMGWKGQQQRPGGPGVLYPHVRGRCAHCCCSPSVTPVAGGGVRVRGFEGGAGDRE